MLKLICASLATLALAATAARAATVQAGLAMATDHGPGASVGSVTLTDSPSGAVVAVDLHGLPPGPHGLHVHAGGSCAPGPDKMGKVIPAGAAGGHFDPAATNRHEGPQGAGHQGDLPRVEVAADGAARARLLAPHVASVEALRGRALMLHLGGDTYSDTPAPLGGGGARLACGVIS